MHHFLVFFPGPSCDLRAGQQNCRRKEAPGAGRGQANVLCLRETWLANGRAKSDYNQSLSRDATKPERPASNIWAQGKFACFHLRVMGNKHATCWSCVQTRARYQEKSASGLIRGHLCSTEAHLPVLWGLPLAECRGGLKLPMPRRRVGSPSP